MGASVSVAQGAPLDAGTYKADEAAVERFCELLRIPTVSRENIAERDDEPFSQWIPTLQRLYPHFFKVAELTRVDDFGMLLRWPGADSALDPIVMIAHQDVVPVEGQDWKHDPLEPRSSTARSGPADHSTPSASSRLSSRPPSI